MAEELKPDEALLFSVKVGEYTITPMSFGLLSQLTPMIADVSADISKQIPPLEEITSVVILDIIMRNLSKLMPIIAAYVNEPIAKIEALPAETGVQLAFTIWSANAKIFLDFFIKGSQLAG